MNLRPYLFIAVAAAAAWSNAQDVLDEKVEGQPTVQELEEILESEMELLAKTHEKARGRLLDAWLKKMKSLAEEQLQSGKLQEATATWEKIATRVPQDVDASSFFEAIGRERVLHEAEAKAVQERVEELRAELQKLEDRNIGAPNPAPRADRPAKFPGLPVGTWHGAWGTTGRTFSLTVDTKGRVRQLSERGGPIISNITLKDGRILIVDHPFTLMELVPYHSQLIVLGWMKADNKTPLPEQPDTVAVLQPAQKPK